MIRGRNVFSGGMEMAVVRALTLRIARLSKKVKRRVRRNINSPKRKLGSIYREKSLQLASNAPRIPIGERSRYKRAYCRTKKRTVIIGIRVRAPKSASDVIASGL